MSKMTIKLGPLMHELLTTLSDDMCTSKVEIIRRALITYKYLHDESIQGRTISITKAGKVLKDVIVP